MSLAFIFIAFRRISSTNRIIGAVSSRPPSSTPDLHQFVDRFFQRIALLQVKRVYFSRISGAGAVNTRSLRRVNCSIRSIAITSNGSDITTTRVSPFLSKGIRVNSLASSWGMRSANSDRSQHRECQWPLYGRPEPEEMQCPAP